MKSSFGMGKIKDIEVRIHISLLLILPLFVAVFILNPPPIGFSDIGSQVLKIAFSLIATVVLFISILVHELAHSLTGMKYGVKVKNITLFLFGGVSLLEEIPRKSSQEIHIAVVGPLTSLGIGAFSLILYLIMPFPASALFRSIGYLNVLLAVFNLIPAFPLDGGRILRGLFSRQMNYVSATKKAAGIGKLLAILMGLIGIFYNFWLILIAFFIYMGANEEENQVFIEGLLKRFRVRDIMTTEVITVRPEITIKELLDVILHRKHLGYPVVDNGKLLGIITLDDVRSVPRDRFDEVTVRDVMKQNLITVTPDDPAYSAFKKMGANRIGRVLVMDGDELAGIVSRTDIIRAISVLELEEEMYGR